MLDTIKISKPLQDLIKIVVSIKIVLLLLFSLVESTRNIKDLQDKNDCIEQMNSIFEGTKDKEISRSKAVHYCSGGKD